jgi:hypothetical protein
MPDPKPYDIDDYSTWTTENLIEHMCWLGDQEVREGEDWADEIIKIADILDERKESDAKAL